MTAVDSSIAPGPRPPRDLSWRPADVAALIVVLLVALGFRVAGIDAMPSADELWHLALTRGQGSPVGQFAPNVAYVDAPALDTLAGAAPAWHVWTHMDGVLHPPLYVLTLRLWRELFGPTDAAAHALSIAWSIVALGFCFAAARLAIGRAAAIWATLLVAVSPVQIYFAQEIRGYEMMIALGAIALWLATRVEVFGPTPRRAAAMAATALPLLLTHYFAAGAALGLAAYAVARLRGRPRVAFIATTLLASVAYAVAWLPFAWRQVASLHTGDAFTKVAEFDLFREFPWALSVPARLFVEKPWMSDTVGGVALLILGIALFALPWHRARRLSSLAPWAAWVTGTAGLLVVLDAARTTWLVQLVRYAAVASPAVPLLFVGIGRTFGARAMHVTAGIMLVALLAVRPAGSVTVSDSPRFTGSARWLAQRIKPGEAVLVVEGRAGPHVADLVALTLAHEPGVFPRTIVKVTGPLTAEALNALPDRAWAVLVDWDHPRVLAALSATTLVERHSIPNEGMCLLLDLAEARRAANAAATRPTSQP